MPVGLETRSAVACALAALCITATEAQSTPPAQESGREWLARCGTVVRAGAADGASSATAACLAWIEGLIDINEIYRGLGALEKTSEGFCMPATATVAQAAEAVARYLQEHERSLHVSARMLAYMALRHAFPCAPPGI